MHDPMPSVTQAQEARRDAMRAMADVLATLAGRSSQSCALLRIAGAALRVQNAALASKHLQGAAFEEAKTVVDSGERNYVVIEREEQAIGHLAILAACCEALVGQPAESEACDAT
jgi:hypothetical protein